MSLVLGNAIKAARLRKGLKQSEIASALGVTRAAVGQWESGANEPSVQNLLKLNGFLGLELQNAVQQPVVARTINQSDGEGLYIARHLPTEGFDVPVDHIVVGEEGFVYNVANNPGIVYVRRFDFFASRPNIYAMGFGSNVLSPRYEQSDIVYVDPDQTPIAGEYAVISFKGIELARGGILSLVRRVTYIDLDRVIASQFKPERRNEYPTASIEKIARVIPEFELVRQLGK